MEATENQFPKTGDVIYNYRKRDKSTNNGFNLYDDIQVIYVESADPEGQTITYFEESRYSSEFRTEKLNLSTYDGFSFSNRHSYYTEHYVVVGHGVDDYAKYTNLATNAGLITGSNYWNNSVYGSSDYLDEYRPEFNILDESQYQFCISNFSKKISWARESLKILKDTYESEFVPFVKSLNYDLPRISERKDYRARTFNKIEVGDVLVLTIRDLGNRPDMIVQVKAFNKDSASIETVGGLEGVLTELKRGDNDFKIEIDGLTLYAVSAEVTSAASVEDAVYNEAIKKQYQADLESASDFFKKLFNSSDADPNIRNLYQAAVNYDNSRYEWWRFGRGGDGIGLFNYGKGYVPVGQHVLRHTTRMIAGIEDTVTTIINGTEQMMDKMNAVYGHTSA